MSISAIDTIDQHKPDAQARGPAASNLPMQSDAQSTSEQAAVPPKPRAPRMPSDRDFQVFRMAEIQGLTHEQIASTCGVSRRRISQIVERVRNWLSQHPCEDPQIATELQRKRLAQHMERMQLQDVIDRARFALTLAPTHLETVTIRADGKESTTRREQPPVDVRILKTYLRAIEAVGRLNQRPEIPLPPPPDGEFPWLKTAIDEVWEKWNDKIAWAKKLKPENFCQFADQLEAAVLKAASHQQLLDSQPSDTDDDEIPLPPEDGGDIRGAVGNALCGVPGASDDAHDAVGNALGGVPGASDDAHDAVGNALCGVPRASIDLGEGDDEIPLPPGERGDRRSPGEGLQARSASEGNVLSITTDPDVAETTTDSSFIPHPSSLPSASNASQREVPTSQPSFTRCDGVTSSAPDTSRPPPPVETATPGTPPSQENPKREAPLPPSPATPYCPPVTEACSAVSVPSPHTNEQRQTPAALVPGSSLGLH